MYDKEMREEQMQDDTILKIENVRKEYVLGTVTGDTLKDALKDRFGKKRQEHQRHNKRFTALDGVSFSVRKGETVGLIGSNGAGKSTLLKLISRITAPTDGRICIDGRVSSMLEVGTGFHQELTGRENIYLNGSILGMSKAEIDQKIDSIIEFSECQKFIDTPVKRYSSGMYVKLAFAVASHLESEIMIMDEVLAVGDMKFQQKCLNKMKEIAESEGRTIIYVSHNMDTIHKLCKRCIVLNHGKVAFDGATNEAVKIYLGDTIREETSIDFTKYIRPGWLGRDDVRLTWAQYPDKKDNVMDEGMDIFLKWKVRKDVEHLALRVEIMDDTERPFATAVFYDIFSGKSGEESETTVHVDLSKVMDGSYMTYYTLFCLDSYHQSVDIDCVRGLEFTVKREGSEKLHWKNASWGNILLSDR
nr:ABC transporter ATP-binding protein [uncultured Anaerostipes sp.]